MIGINTYTRIEMEEVPANIWDAVYDKWRQAYLDGWDYHTLWRGCALCKWQGDNSYKCRQCPLGTDSWCNSYGCDSRISIRYRGKDGYTYGDDEDKWRVEISKFLRFLKPYCTHEIN